MGIANKLSDDGWISQHIQHTWSKTAVPLPDTLMGPEKPLIPKWARISKVIQYYGSQNVENESENIDGSRQLQKDLFKSWNKEMYSQLQDKLPVTHLARLAALKAKGAAAWMYPPPLGIHAITDDTCRHAHRLRLCLPTIHTNNDRICVCGERIQGTRHLLSCSRVRGGEAIRRHNDVVNILGKYIRKAGGLAKAEPSSVSTDNRDRVDIEAHLGSLHLHIDVRITHPTSPSYMHVAMKTLGAAINTKRKKTKTWKKRRKCGCSVCAIRC